MRKKIWIALAAAMMMLLCACAEKPAEQAPEAQTSAVQTEQTAPAAPENAPEQTDEKEDVPAEASAAAPEKAPEEAAEETEEAEITEEPETVALEESPEENETETGVEEIPIEEPIAEEQPAEEESEPVWTPRAELTVDAAKGFIGSSVCGLTATYGVPDTSYYEYSCSGPGDDGILTYGNVTIYTYREPDGSAETVVDAE